MIKQRNSQINQSTNETDQFLCTFQSQKSSTTRSIAKFVRKPEGSKLQRKKKTNTSNMSIFCYQKLTEEIIKQQQKSFNHSRSDFTINFLDKTFPTVIEQKQNEILTDEIDLSTQKIKRQLLTKSKQKNYPFRQLTNDISISMKLQQIKRNRSQSMITPSSKKQIIKLSANENQKIKQKKLMNNKTLTFQQNNNIKLRRKQSENKFDQNTLKLEHNKSRKNLVEEIKCIKQIPILLDEIKKYKKDCSYYMNMLQQKNKQLAIQTIKYKNIQKTNIQLQYQMGQLKFYVKQLQTIKSNTKQQNKQSDLPQLFKIKSQLILKYKENHQLNQQNLSLNNEIDRLTKQLLQQKQSIYQLKNQLKYSQIQINMLNRVNLQINTKNQQLIKMQNLNQILKNQLEKLRKTYTKNMKKNKQVSLISINSINSLTSISESLIGSQLDISFKNIQKQNTEGEHFEGFIPLPITHTKTIKRKSISQSIQKYR